MRYALLSTLLMLACIVGFVSFFVGAFCRIVAVFCGEPDLRIDEAVIIGGGMVFTLTGLSLCCFLHEAYYQGYCDDFKKIEALTMERDDAVRRLNNDRAIR
jgi:hypothetical protein